MEPFHKRIIKTAKNKIHKKGSNIEEINKTGPLLRITKTTTYLIPQLFLVHDRVDVVFKQLLDNHRVLPIYRVLETHRVHGLARKHRPAVNTDLQTALDPIQQAEVLLFK